MVCLYICIFFEDLLRSGFGVVLLGVIIPRAPNTKTKKVLWLGCFEVVFSTFLEGIWRLGVCYVFGIFLPKISII